MAIQLRTNKASALTYNEMDRNFSSFFYSASIDNGNILKLWYTGSSTLNTGGEDFGPARFVPVDLQPTTGAVPTLTVAGDPRTIQFRHSTNPILDADNGFVYSTAQQLGIGVSLPAANTKIHARGTSTISATLRLESNATVGTNRRAAVDFYQGSTFMGTIGRHDHNDNNLYIKSFVPGGRGAFLQDPGHIRFVVGNNVNYGAFTQAGFGIGTFLPQHLFHAEGNGYFAGRLGVGTGPGSAALHVFQTAQTGTLLGDFETIAQFGITPQGNVDSLKILSVRQQAGGADWLSNGMRIQQDVDGSYHPYIQFSGFGNLHGFSIGTGESTSPHKPGDIGIAERFRITSTGKVGINTVAPNAQLDVNGDTIVTGSFTTTVNATVGLALTTGTTAAVGTNLTVGGTATIGNIPAGTAGAGTKILTANNAGQIQYITGTFPLGGIVMWAGSPTAPPAGWTLCDGSAPVNGVTIPDLRERFIVGAGGNTPDLITYNYDTFAINSATLPFRTGTNAQTGAPVFTNISITGTFTRVNNTSAVSNGLFSNSINSGNNNPPGLLQSALYVLTGPSPATSYFLVYHLDDKNYRLYRGSVPANSTNVGSLTTYPYYSPPQGSVAILSNVAGTLTQRPNFSTLIWSENNAGYAVGDKGGFNNIKLGVSELPSHNHGYLKGVPGRGYRPEANDYPHGSNVGDLTSLVGGDLPHENRPPYYALAFIIYTGA